MGELQRLADYVRDRIGDANAHDRANLAAMADDVAKVSAFLKALADLPEDLRALVIARLDDAPRGRDGPPDERPAADGRAAGHRFERQLRGGTVEGLRVRVPESTVRDLGLETGDRLEYTPRNTIEDGPPLFDFRRVARSQEAHVRRREELPMGVVERRGLDLVVRRLVGDGRHLDPPVVLPDADVASLNIQEGALVDLARWEDDPTDVRVAWVHRGLRDPEDPASSQPAGAAAPRHRARGPEEPPTANLAGMRVLVVGFEPRRADYQQAIERIGGSMDWISGEEDRDRVLAAVDRADGVVVLTGSVSHQASRVTVECCKALSRPYHLLSKRGVKSVAAAAIDLIARAEVSNRYA